MKENLFFVAYDYQTVKKIASKVAEFFGMRMFDSIEMFEFDHTPRKLEEVLEDFGLDYVRKKMKNIVKMQLDFGESIFIGDMDYLEAWKGLFNKIKDKNLVVFLNDKNLNNQSLIMKQNKIEFLSSCCDIAVEIADLIEEEAFEKVLDEIKNYFNIEV